MRKLNNYSAIITIISLTILVISSFLVSTYSYFNEYIIPIIMLIFWLVIIGIMYVCYKFFHKKAFLILIILSLVSIIISMIRGILYEYKVDKLHIGMVINEVENLYGTGASGLGFGSKGLGSSSCLKCNGNSYQFFYRLEGNLWYSHLEDSYHVCYINDIVCDFDRIGL